MLSLISHFGVPESTLKKSTSIRDSQFLLEGHANSILFVRNFVSKASGSKLVFFPSLAEAIRSADPQNLRKFCIN